MSSPSVKGAELGPIVESAAVVAGDVEGAVLVEDSENFVEVAFDPRTPVASSWQFTDTARDPFALFLAT